MILVARTKSSLKLNLRLANHTTDLSNVLSFKAHHPKTSITVTCSLGPYIPSLIFLTSHIALNPLTFTASSDLRPRSVYILPFHPHEHFPSWKFPPRYHPERVYPTSSNTLLEHLEIIHNIKFNNKLYNLIQNTNNEFSNATEQVKIIRELALLWPFSR